MHEIFSELDGYNDKFENESAGDTRGTKFFVPRVFSMKPQIKERSDLNLSGVHFPPANDDEKQFNLLKFYELNATAVKLLLDREANELDLPFTPGQLDHDIIHHKSDPPRSILLMGRSGTGKNDVPCVQDVGKLHGIPASSDLCHQE